jgi:hypothetical protein
MLTQQEELNVIERSTCSCSLSHEHHHVMHCNKNVANCIMGSYMFVAVNTTQKVNTHKINGMCAHTSRDNYNRKM